jgi:hypothetical protein
VEITFKLTMQNAVIENIQRIQNPKLWKVFNNEKKDVEHKNGGQAQVKTLFHGTSNTPPKLIYESEEGFNLNYSN